MDKVSFIAGFRSTVAKTVREDYFTTPRNLSSSREYFHKKYNELVYNKFNGFVVLCNYTTGQYEYVSANVKDNLGYDLSGLSVEDLTNFLGSIIYEKHVEVMVDSFLPLVYNYLKENATAQTGTDYRSTCCVKLKNIYGTYYWYLLDTAIVQVDENGFPLTTLITCTNINQFKNDECMNYNILKKNEDDMYEIVLEGIANNGLNEYNLTPREIQILNLISQGYSNKETAGKLNISILTVQTHRKSILKKVNCKGTAELTKFAFSRGLV